MTLRFFISTFLLVGFLFAACTGSKTGQQQAITANNDELLLGTWMLSHEENGKAPNGASIYRNVKVFKFPPARGRTGFTFSTESKCIYLGIAPTDGTEEQPGRWGWGGKNQLRITLENGKAFNFKVIELTSEKLVMQEE